jgi:hypothetical protein
VKTRKPVDDEWFLLFFLLVLEVRTTATYKTKKSHKQICQF